MKLPSIVAYYEGYSNTLELMEKLKLVKSWEVRVEHIHPEEEKNRNKSCLIQDCPSM